MFCTNFWIKQLIKFDVKKNQTSYNLWWREHDYTQPAACKAGRPRISEEEWQRLWLWTDRQLPSARHCGTFTNQRCTGGPRVVTLVRARERTCICAFVAPAIYTCVITGSLLLQPVAAYIQAVLIYYYRYCTCLRSRGHVLLTRPRTPPLASGS